MFWVFLAQAAVPTVIDILQRAAATVLHADPQLISPAQRKRCQGRGERHTSVAVLEVDHLKGLTLVFTESELCFGQDGLGALYPDHWRLRKYGHLVLSGHLKLN